MNIEPIKRQDINSRMERIENKLDLILDRLARTEEKHQSLRGKAENHDALLAEHANRIRELELRHAVSTSNAEHVGKQLMKRWGTVGAAALVLLGAVGSTLAKILMEVFRP